MPPTTRSKRKHQQAELEEELLLCARQGNLDRVRELVLIERVSVNCSDEDGLTTLHWAVGFGRAGVVQFLLENGAKVDAANNDGNSALGLAIRRDLVAIATLLLDYGADIEKRCYNTDDAAYSPLGCALELSPGTVAIHPLKVPLLVSLKYDKLEMAQLLVDRGANVNHGSLLCFCAEHEKCEGARLLLGAGANVNQTQVNDSGKTPLWIAAECGSIALVREFLKAGADVNIRDNGGETPLGVAHRKGHNGAFYLLLRTSPHVWLRLRDVW